MCRVFAVCRAPTISRLPFPNDVIAGKPLSRSIEALYPKRKSGTPVMMWNCVLIVKQFHARATKPSHLPLRILSCMTEAGSIAHLIRGGFERGLAFARGRDAAWMKGADASPGHGPVRGSSPTCPSPTRRSAFPGLHRYRSSISPSDRHGATASNQGQDHTYTFRFMKPLLPRPSHACSGVERHRPGFDSNS